MNTTVPFPLLIGTVSESEKSKHSLFCDEHHKNYCQLVAKFPSPIKQQVSWLKKLLCIWQETFPAQN